MQQRRKTIFLPLVVSVVALNLFIVALVAMALTESRTRKEAEVRTTLENLALLLDQSISSSVRGVDHSLRDISQHLERGLQSHGPLLDADASKLLAFHEN